MSLMNKGGSPTDFNLHLIFFIIFFIIGLSSCSPTTTPQEAIVQPTLTPPVIIDYRAWEEVVLLEGKHARNEFCSSSFSYKSRTLGLLTVAISNNLDELEDIDDIYHQVFNRYDLLFKESPLTFQTPINIFVIPESILGNCVSNGVDIFSSLEMISSVSLAEDIIGASTEISEYWVKAGLAYIASGEEVDTLVLKKWYQETEDLDILGLFIARFSMDWVTQVEVDIARMTAASLIVYCVENEDIPIDTIGASINNDLRNRWLQTIGVSRSVDYPYDGLYDHFSFSKSENCSLVAESEEIYFCLNRLQEQPYFDMVNEAEDFIIRSYNDYMSLTDFLEINAPSITPILGPDERIVIEVNELAVALGYTDGKTIRINNSAVLYDVLHEIVHSYNWNYRLIFGNDNLVLGEGFAEYLGKYLQIGEQPIKTLIWEDFNGRESSPGISYWYCLDEEQLSAAIDWYWMHGGSLESEDSIDSRLFLDAIAFVTMYRDAHGGPLGISMGEKYERLNISRDISKMDGMELSYTQAASYAAWLSDTYTLDAVLDYFVNKSADTALEGKGYAELKLDWLAYLVSEGEGIQVPDSP